MQRLALLVLIAFAVLATPACDTPRDGGASRRLVELRGATMGTYWVVRCGRLPPGVASRELTERIDALLERVNDLMSTWRPDSELSRFNRSPSTDWIAVSHETAEVVAEALEVARVTDGAFDPTVLPLVELWGFGPGAREGDAPDEDAIAAARALVGARHVEARTSPPALRKELPGVRLDLSAIAKGWAVDRVSELLRKEGIEACLVEIGGELRVSGGRPGGGAWRVGIERPTGSQRRVAETIVDLEDRAIATSGDYRNFREVDGRRLSHTIDPRTGKPVEHSVASCSVVAPTCMRADALATAGVVLGVAAGLELADRLGLAVSYTSHEGSDFAHASNPAFERLLSPHAP